MDSPQASPSTARSAQQGANPVRAVREVLVVGVAALLALPLGVVDGPFPVGVHVAVAIAAGALLVARRRAPLLVAAAMALLLGAGFGVQVPALVALVGVAVRRTWQRTLLAAVLLLLGYSVSVLLGLLGDDPVRAWTRGGWIPLAAAVVVLGAVAGIGLYLGARRQLLTSAQERAERAEAEQRAMAEQARRRERTRIAREMHDVLAHRLSMLALQAGALEYRAHDPESAQAAGAVRETAHQALQELRDVLGVLRDDGDDVAGAASEDRLPQPTLADVRQLIAEARGAAPVQESVEGDLYDVPPTVGRSAYRVVQEGLTNARRHAPGAAVTVRLTATDDSLAVEVRNAPPPRTDPAAPMRGSGSGLVGVRERAALLGGRAIGGPTDDGGWLLRVDLPLDARTPAGDALLTADAEQRR